jgi:hypothetical protein
MNTRSTRPIVAAVLLTLAAAPVIAQEAAVDLRAATAQAAGGKVEVRLRWRPVRGWVPAGGYRLYRTDGTRRLVYSSRPPEANRLQALGLSVPLLGKAGTRSTAADAERIAGPITRAQSSAAQFAARAQAANAARTAAKGRLVPSLPPSDEQDDAPEAFAARRLPALDEEVLRARRQIATAALLQPEAAAEVGLGAADGAVQPGAKVSYALMAVDAAGKESQVGALPEFVVGADPAPPAPTGLQALQDGGEVELRWDRVPADREEALGLVSYRVRRADAASPAGRQLNKKPLLILDPPGGKEPVAFFTDNPGQPGPATYSLTLVDGFGRESAPASVRVTVEEWRTPSAVARVHTELDELRIRRTGTARLRQGFQIPAQPAVSVTWLTAAGTVAPVRYNIYRTDLDAPNAAPVRLTPAAIEGEPLTEAQSRELLADLVGDTDAAPAADRAEAIARAKRTARMAALLKAAPPRRIVDRTARSDSRYRYAVVALYGADGPETEETASVPVDVPDGRAPAAPGVPVAEFKAAQARPRVLTLNHALKPVPVRSLRTGAAARIRTPLTLAPKDDGGTVTLRWAASAGPRGTSYRISRLAPEPGSQPVQVGSAQADVLTFTDSVPRSYARRYNYTITPVSRWGVAGVPAIITVDTPATMPPTRPALLSVAPGGDGEIVLRLQPNDPAESVGEYEVRREGAPVRIVQRSEEGGTLVLKVAAAAPGAYSVIARNTTARLDSPESERVTAAPLVTTAAAPTGLRAAPGAGGVALTWTAPAGAAGYLISRSSGMGAAVELGGRLAAAAFTDATAFRGKTYTYAIRALDAHGNVSAPVQVTVTVP